MKLTTKIVLGVIVSILIVMMINMFLDLRARANQDDVNNKFTFAGETTKLNITSGFKVIIIQSIGNLEQDVLLDFSKSTLNVQPIADGDSIAKIILPKETADCTKISYTVDTLFLTLKIDELVKLRGEEKAGSRILCVAIDWTLYLDDSSLVAINSQMADMKIQLSKISANDLIINANTGKVEVLNSEIKSLSPNSDPNKSNRKDPSKWLVIKNSKIDSLTVNPDYLKHENIEGSDIRIINLIGSSHYQHMRVGKDTKVMYWTPQNEDANLYLSLKNKKARIEILD